MGRDSVIVMWSLIFMCAPIWPIAPTPPLSLAESMSIPSMSCATANETDAITINATAARVVLNHEFMANLDSGAVTPGNYTSPRINRVAGNCADRLNERFVEKSPSRLGLGVGGRRAP